MSTTSISHIVWAMTVYNNELIAAGFFTGAGGTSVSNIARWNGTSWQGLGNGLNDRVNVLAVYDNKLIAGGAYTSSAGTTMNYVASWDGSTWSPIGTGFDDEVRALGEYNGYLIAGGAFSTAGGMVALWDGSIWRPVSDIVTDVPDGRGDQLPSSFSLDQNYPNPFNPSTVIEYNLLENSHAKVEVFNVNGQKVKLLLDQSMPAGDHSVVWDGTTDADKKVSSGVYFYRLTVDEFAQSKKMILLK